MENELQHCREKPYELIFEELMQIMEIHDPQRFRRKVKGVRVVPFAMKDFYYRIAKDEYFRLNNQKRDKLTAAQIRQKVIDMRERREKEAKLRDLRIKRSKKQQEEHQKKKL